MNFFIAFFLFGFNTIPSNPVYTDGLNYQGADFTILHTRVTHQAELGMTVWEIQVKGNAGATTPEPAGKLDGAPVLGYVFPTTLAPATVGFGDVEGILALALTSHPDFDDTPLWDENSDTVFDNDGAVWHPHWVVLQQDTRVKGGLSVVQFTPGDTSVKLPPTNPGMPMYMDSPGFPVVVQNDVIRVTVPDYRINHQLDFKFDAVTCYLQVNTSNDNVPMLGVYEVYHIGSGDLSLPYAVTK